MAGREQAALSYVFLQAVYRRLGDVQEKANINQLSEELAVRLFGKQPTDVKNGNVQLTPGCRMGVSRITVLGCPRQHHERQPAQGNGRGAEGTSSRAGWLHCSSSRSNSERLIHPARGQ